MSSSNKRKFDDLAKDTRPEETAIHSRPFKKLKSSSDATVVETFSTDNCTSLNALPDLEIEDEEPQLESPIFKVGDLVQIIDDDDGTTHQCKIDEMKIKKAGPLYLVREAWLPQHKLTSVEQQPQEVQNEQDQATQQPNGTNATNVVMRSASTENNNNNNNGDPETSSNDDDTIEEATDVRGAEIEEEEDSAPQSAVAAPGKAFNEKLYEFVRKPAKQFAFELDTFQFEAIKAMETENADLLITAHTSAGKTVIAEYAIAKALQANQRVIYTSPIKALSNQKYREFSDKFGSKHLGLITGDVCKRKNASVLVMTTEILRNMLYQGGWALREVAYVIFDEVHYMRNEERGVVWEESIILLNRKITLIFLSATISNSDDFAAWISSIKRKECRIIGTEQRPITLEHYVYPEQGNAVYLVATSHNDNQFLKDNFELARQSSVRQKTSAEMDQHHKRAKLKIGEIQLLLFMIYKQQLYPAIFFAFAKREVEAHAMALNDAINLCTAEESAIVESVFMNAIDSLTEKDKALPAVTSLLPLLKKGIGVHHGGILPILKEVTEILFQEGLIKVLFATETFAMGVNMPAKCVVFTGIEKYDGKSHRMLNSSEYTQMSGRAGRRGLDDKGVVIMMMTKSMKNVNVAQFESLICGKAAALTSSFRLTFNMLLNISKNNDESGYISHQSIIDQSFYRFLMTQRIPQMESAMKGLRVTINEMENRPDFDDMQLYYDMYGIKRSIERKMQSVLTQPYIVNKYLKYGRVVFVEYGECCYGWGVVMACAKRYQPSTYFVDVLVSFQKKQAQQTTAPEQQQQQQKIPSPIVDADLDLCTPIDFAKLSSSKRDMYGVGIVRFDLSCLSKISTVCLTSLPSRVRHDHEYELIWRKLLSVKRHFVGSIPELDPLKEMNILVEYKQADKTDLVQQFEQRLPTLVQRMSESNFFKNEFVGKDNYHGQERVYWRLYSQYKQSKKTYEQLASKISTYNVGQFAAELKCKCRVLKKLSYLNDENILSPKGIAAAYLEATHEILITELMFDNAFEALTPQEACAVISVFIAERSSKSNADKDDKAKSLQFPLTVAIHDCYEKVLVKARDIINTKKECGLTEELGLYGLHITNEDDYIAQFATDLMSPILHWVNGVEFAEVIQLTTLFEGSLIRSIKRLRDLLAQLVDAAKAIGNDALTTKFEVCVDKLQRGIVFAASLYIGEEEEEEEDDEENKEDKSDEDGEENDGDGEDEDEDMDMEGESDSDNEDK